MTERVAVLGDGAWGTALAISLAANGASVHLWSAFPDYAARLARTRENVKFLPGVGIPEAVEITAEAACAFEGASLALAVVPTQYIRPTLARIALSVPEGLPVASCAKGLELGTLKRPTEILREVFPGSPVAVVSGPSHAEEVARGLPTSVVAASGDAATAARFQAALAGPRLRVYTSADVLGVELGAALKNVVAIAAGIAAGLELGDNTLAALITRGSAEMARLGAALGADARTFAGLSGVGDLIATCTSRHSRNRRTGERLARGEALEAILASTEGVAEGVPTTRAAVELARARDVELPIAEMLARVFGGEIAPREAVLALMTRPPRAE